MRMRMIWATLSQELHLLCTQEHLIIMGIKDGSFQIHMTVHIG